ncbi:MAG TPA: AMP-binding protein, partial [Labilithrix sp.]
MSSLFAMRARVHPTRVAIEDASRKLTYAELDARVRRTANVLAGAGVRAGDRVALVSENRVEHIELALAAGRIGAALACPGWRLAPPEIAHCIALVEPRCTIVSARHASKVARADFVLGDEWDARLARAPSDHEAALVDPEDALLILYTSGTTGLPKGAVLSHRAEIFRNLVVRADFGVTNTDAFVAWSPLYHMGAMEPSLGALMSGGSVVVVDGFDRARLAELVASRELGWLLLMPGMVASFVEELRARAI